MRKNYLLVALFAILSLSVGAREKQDGWKQLGTGTFCDDMFSALDDSFLATWDVEIEESETTPGYYRLINPFGNGNCPYFGDKNNFKANDLYIHAEDPEHVWMEWQDMGFSVSNYGGVSVSCMVGLYIHSEIFTFEDLLNPDYGIEFGKLADGKITFPDNKMYYLQIAFANYLEGVPMNGNTHNKFLVTLPAQDGVDEITVDDAEQGTPEYYNMQGMRVDNPTPGCLYIRRTGSKVEKIIAR